MPDTSQSVDQLRQTIGDGDRLTLTNIIERIDRLPAADRRRCLSLLAQAIQQEQERWMLSASEAPR
jgi:hypothetical protein